MSICWTWDNCEVRGVFGKLGGEESVITGKVFNLSLSCCFFYSVEEKKTERGKEKGEEERKEREGRRRRELHTCWNCILCKF